jgi:hypothetical protein
MPPNEAASGKAERMALWRRLILIGISLGVGLAVAGLGIVWGMYSYQNRPIPPTTWDPIELPQIGIKAWLKTEWRDGSLRYQFRVSPLSPELTKAFDKAANSSSKKTFTVLFYDDAGFKLCDYEVTPGPEVDTSGQVAALVSIESTWLCSSGNYRQARRWNLSYVFPTLSTERKSRKRTSTPNVRTTSLEGTDSLTGFDYMSCRMETRSGHTFLLYRPGECTTALQWRVSARLRYACKTKRDCLVENLGNNQAVHARLLK